MACSWHSICITLDEFELEVIRKMVEDMPKSMSMSIEEGVSFGIMLQIAEQHAKEEIFGDKP